MRVVEGRATVDDVDEFLAALSAAGEATGCTVQAFDARYVMGREHVRRAVELADRAFDRGENVARDRGVEVLLYAAGRRQINRALAMGVDEGEHPVVVVVADDEERSVGNDDDTPSVENGDDARPVGNDESESDDHGGTTADERAAAERVADLLAPADTLGVEHADLDRVRSFFGVSEREEAAAAGDLQDLVLERVALLDVEK